MAKKPAKKPKRKPLSAKASAGTRMYIKYSSKSKILLPVTPENLSFRSSYGVNRVNVAHRGETTTFGFRELKEIELESFFPAKYNPAYCTTSAMHSPNYYRSKIESYRDKRKPLLFIAPDLKISMSVIIESFDYEYKGGEKGDIHYKIKMTQYKAPPSTKIKPKKKPSKKPSKKPTSSGNKGNRKPSSSKFTVKKGQTHKVRSGENLSKISAKYYGTQTKWRSIYDINRKLIGANPNNLKVGMKLVIRKK